MADRIGREAGIRHENRERLIRYFHEGEADPASPGKLGVEVEHFIVQDKGSLPVYYEAHDGVPGVRDALSHLREFYPEEARNSHGDLLGLADGTGSITLEPAAQMEMSIAPYERVADIEGAYRAFRGHLDPYLAQCGCHVASCGYHPSARALDLPLIPKERYRFMDSHFIRIGSHGERMMRASASTQVSIDYHGEADAVRKLRIATAIGPVLAYICDNIPVFEGEPNEGRLTRLNLWRDVDGARCGSIPGIFDEGFGFAAYADWLLRTPPIFVTRPAADDPAGPALRGVGDIPAADAYADAPMEKRDIEHLISMFWPDVRLKRFVEIRQADCMPAEDVYGYAALVKGLFYSEESLSGIEEALGVRGGLWPLDDGSTDEGIAAIRAGGADAIVHGMRARDWADLLFELAAGALDAPSGNGDRESRYLAPLRARANRRANDG